MSTPVSMMSNYGAFTIQGEVDLSNVGAVTAVRGTGLAATKTGTGTYAITYVGSENIPMYEILSRQADLAGSPTGAFWAKVTSVSQAQVAPDSPITVNITLLSNAVTPIAADVTAVCTLTFEVTMRAIRDPQSAPL